MTIPLKHFYMIRHGESEANVAEIASGHMDVALTSKGIKQAESAREVISNLSIKPNIIFHSNLSRARDTATIINRALHLDMIENQDLAEHNFGDWEGEPWSYTRPRIQNGENPPNGETHEIFNQRVGRGISEALKHAQEPPLIVCHGGVYRGFTSHFDFQLGRIENCTLYEFTPSAEKASKWRVNIHTQDGVQDAL